MAYTFAFTVTQVVNSFTATITTPLSLALTNTPDSVAIYQTTATVYVNNNISPVTITGASAYNQSLNTGDNVRFETLTTPAIYGSGGAPVSFPNGLSISNNGTVLVGGIDFGPFV